MKHLLHHPVVDIAEALFADGTGFQAFGFTRAADDVTLPTLDDRRRHPIVAYGAIEMFDQRVVINEAASCAQRRQSACSAHVSRRRLSNATLPGQSCRWRPAFDVSASIWH